MINGLEKTTEFYDGVADVWWNRLGLGNTIRSQFSQFFVSKHLP